MSGYVLWIELTLITSNVIIIINDVLQLQKTNEEQKNKIGKLERAIKMAEVWYPLIKLDSLRF